MIHCTYSAATSINSGVTRVGDIHGGKWGCHPSIFPWKNWRPFLVITVSASSAGVTPVYFLLKTDDLFCSSLFIDFTRVPFPGECHPAPFIPVRPRFSTILCKFANKFFSFRCHPLEGVTRGGPPPSNAAVNKFNSIFGNIDGSHLVGQVYIYLEDNSLNIVRRWCIDKFKWLGRYLTT